MVMVATESRNRGSGGVGSSFFVEEEGDWVCPNFRGMQTFGGCKLSGGQKGNDTTTKYMY